VVQKLMSGPLEPWIGFALEAAPSAAILAFIFVFLVALLFSLLLLCASDPKKMLGAVLRLGLVAGLYAAVHVGGVVALFGWPALWVFERSFGVSPELKSWMTSLLTLNYVSVGLVVATALAIVVVLMVLGIWKEQKKIRSPWEKKQTRWRTWHDQQVRPATAKEERLPSDDYRRIGLIVGSVFLVCPMIVGVFVAGSERSLLPLIFAGLIGIVMFFLPYGIGRLLGWILDGLVFRVEGRT
jgi:hypothetical protein